MIVYSDPDIKIHQGDVLQVLPDLPDGSVDCVITSPPYYGLRDYGVDGQIGLEGTPELFLDRMVSVFREVRRVLADHGTAWVNMGDSYAGSSQSGGTNPAGLLGYGNSGTRDVRKTFAPARGSGDAKPKDLLGIPWRLALALQADGWYLRADVIWAKPNPMPESVTDRPTKAHEYVFLLTKRPRYYYDADAIREPAIRAGEIPGGTERGKGQFGVKPGWGSAEVPSARNARSVWTIATEAYPEAHFATYPTELVRRCLLAGCPERVCRTCGKPSERIVEVTYDNPGNRTTNGPRSLAQRHEAPGFAQRLERRAETVGWSDCGHDAYRSGIVLDPFLGSGTTAHVARLHARHAVGIELNPDYIELAKKRFAQQSLFAGL